MKDLRHDEDYANRGMTFFRGLQVIETSEILATERDSCFSYDYYHAKYNLNFTKWSDEDFLISYHCIDVLVNVNLNIDFISIYDMRIVEDL